jgi:UDP:flavonoid glycosyltransferase YjiC (YdhE family)
MSRFLICTMPLAGHINPALPIASALVRRGHEVWWYTGRTFRAAVEAAGARHAPMQAAAPAGDEAFFPKLPELSGLAAANWGIKRAFIDPIPGQVADLRRILAEFPADVLVSDQVFGGAEALHELGGPPWATLGISALTLSSRDTAPANTTLPPSASALGRLRNRFLTTLVNRVVLRDATSHLQYVRWTLGLPPLRRGLFDMASPFLYMHSSTPAFEYPRSDLPPQVHFIGPLLPEAPHDFAPPAWWPELRGGRPVVLVNQGTVATDPGDLIVPALRALADEDVLVVAATGGVAATQVARAWSTAPETDLFAEEMRLALSVGRMDGFGHMYHVPLPARPKPPASSRPGALPANARIEPFIPFGALLPHVAVMVTNGGYGGVQFALAHGVPLVVAGGSEEKPAIAARVAWSGAGISLGTGSPTPEQLHAAVVEALDTPYFRWNARRIKADYARHNAPEEAAALLERLAETGRPVLRSEPLPLTPTAAPPLLPGEGAGGEVRTHI